MKNLNVTITDNTDAKLNEIMETKHFKNRADAIEFLIEEVYKQLKQKQARGKAIELGIKGQELRK